MGTLQQISALVVGEMCPTLGETLRDFGSVQPRGDWE